LGNLNFDHWFQYISDFQQKKLILNDDNNNLTLEICMHDISNKKVKKFFHKKGNESFISAKQTTIDSGIINLIPGMVIDEFQFDPCGYSMNGLFKEFYSTIHITPEDHCSYASYETNINLIELNKFGKSFENLINEVLDIFLPKRFSLIFFKKNFNITNTSLKIEEFKSYTMKTENFYDFDESCSIQHNTFLLQTNELIYF